MNTATAASDPVAEARAASLAANRAYRVHTGACVLCAARWWCADERRLDRDASAADWALQVAREKAAV